MVVCKRQAGRIFGEKVVGSGPVRSYIHASVLHPATVADPWITLCRPRVEQLTASKMHVLCGALVMKALLMLNNCSVVSHEVGGHRTAP